jgi:hypothetical protein
LLQVQISVPLTRTAVSTTASFEVRSPKRLQVQFEKGTIKTPELLSDIEVPDSISVLGQVVDLSQVKGVLTPVSQGLSGIISQVRSGGAVGVKDGSCLVLVVLRVKVGCAERGPGGSAGVSALVKHALPQTAPPNTLLLFCACARWATSSARAPTCPSPSASRVAAPGC